MVVGKVRLGREGEGESRGDEVTVSRNSTEDKGIEGNIMEKEPRPLLFHASPRHSPLFPVFLISLFLLIFSLPVAAKTLYVDGAAGDDAAPWAANGPSNPWRTVGRAAWGSANRAAPNGAEAAQAGDVVSIATGTYASALNTGTGRYDILYNPANNGAAGDPITFRAEGTVAIQAPSLNGPAIGASGRNYIHWTGPFWIDETYIRTAPDTGPVVLHANTGSGVDGATIHGAGAIWADNHVGVRIDSCNGCFARDNTISHFESAQSPASQNGACIMMYDSQYIIIEHNDISDCGSGVFVKGEHAGEIQQRITIRFNDIHNMLNHAIDLLASTDDL